MLQVRSPLFLLPLVLSGCISAVSYYDRGKGTPAPDAATMVTPPPVTVTPVLAAPRERWGKADVPTRANLLGVSAPTAETAIAVGDAGTVLRTSDGGKTWRLLKPTPPIDDKLVDVSFIDGKLGWALGEKALYHTKDGGESWSGKDLFGKLETYGVPQNEVPQVVVRDYGRAAFLTRAHVFETRDGGETWQILQKIKLAIGGPGDELAGARRLVPLGDGWALLTPAGLFKIGGEKPERAEALTQGFTASDLVMKDGQTGWATGAVGAKSAWRKTTDGGRTWSTTEIVIQQTGPNSPKFLPGPPGRLLVVDDMRALVWGNDGLAETRDGVTWRVGPRLDFGIADLALPDMAHGYAVGPGGTIYVVTSL